jgi:hypothetical protein
MSAEIYSRETSPKNRATSPLAGVRRAWRCTTAWAGVWAACLVACGVAARAQGSNPLVRTQVFALKAGWNAIYVDVEPDDPAPGLIFTNTPVTKVAGFFPNNSPVEYIQDPASAAWKQSGWRVWYAPSMPESAINDLGAVRGGQGYLVHAMADASLRIAGEIRLRRLRWRSDSFNLVGFPVNPEELPTFATWFAGSTAHQSDTRAAIYSLDASGYWRPVSQPQTTVIQPGVAYWVFSKGGSDYQGPLDVSIPAGAGDGRLAFGGAGESQALLFKNPAGFPIRFNLTLESSGTFPLTRETRLPGRADPVQAPIVGTESLGPVEPGSKLSVRFSLDRARLSDSTPSAVITVRDDVGSLVRIPVTGRNP